MRPHARTALVALPLVLGLALTGCGSEDDDRDGVASAATGTASDTESKKPKLSRQEQGLRFARCMRENGVAMEDPVEGRITVKRNDGVDKAALEKAMAACREFQPQGAGPGGKVDPKIAEGMRKFAACMRKNGVEKFPDPGADGGIRINGMVNDAEFKKAEELCGDLLTKAREGAEKS
ncbi:hypothetical protein [Streptomyces sp. NPDC020965]|uniref:hypothetical protein n=1 Tax=Streptomyces sp. NPDC020965 TaxID=3365105 RepID=UPI00378A7F33